MATAVYLSSTLSDLLDERRAAKEVLASQSLACKESYAVSQTPLISSCLAEVAASDAYVAIVGMRYGYCPADSLANPHGKSITELEFEKAQACNTPCFVFLKSDKAPYVPDQMDAVTKENGAGERINDFRSRIGSGERLRPAQFETIAQLREQLIALAGQLSRLAGPQPAPFSWPKARNFKEYIDNYNRSFIGRQWLTTQLLDWLQEGTEQAMLILAPFGVGKSAFMANSALALESQGRGTVIHFCRFDSEDDLRPGRIVGSLAAQIKDHLPAYKAAVENDPEACKALTAAESKPAFAWSRAVVDPLVTVGQRSDEKPLVLLIDGLDESLELHDASGEQDGSLLEMILKGTASRLPHWVRVVTSSRRVRQLGAQVHRFKVIDMLEACGDQNRHDLEEFIRRRARTGRLQQLIRDAAMDEERFVRAVGDLCDGKFLLAHYLTKEAEKHDFGSADLDRVLQRSREIPGMDAYYEWVFDKRVQRALLDTGKTRAVLGMVSAALAPLRENMLADVLGDEGITEDEVMEIVAAFGGLLRHDDDAGVTFDHLSIEQWLDKSRPEGRNQAGRPKAGHLAIEREESMRRLQRHCKRMAALPYPSLVARGFARYLEKFGVIHLVDAGDLPGALALLMTLPLDTPAHRRASRSFAPPPRRLEDRVIGAIALALQSFDHGEGDAADRVGRLDARHLHRLLKSRDYETGRYQPIIRALIQFKPLDWDAVKTDVLQSLADDVVLRNDVGVAYAEAWHSSSGAERPRLLAVIESMARNQQRADERELAGYALKHICQKLDPEPWWNEIAGTIRNLAERYASSDIAVDRLMAGEMLLALALQGVPVRDWFANQAGAARFWQPYWPHLRVDIEAICAHAETGLRWTGPMRETVLRSFDAAKAQRDLAQALSARLLAHPLFVQAEGKPNLSCLTWAVGSLADQQCDTVALDEALEPLAALVDRADCKEVIFDVLRRLMLHPSWDLTESSAVLLADLIKRKGCSDGPWWLIDRLLESEPTLWRLHYGAIEAAFNVGSMDGFQKFRQAVVAVGCMDQCRVRGICAENLRMWVKKAGLTERALILGDSGIRDVLQCWLQTADDICLLEYLYRLFSELWQGGSADRALLQSLLPATLQHYLVLDPQRAFYELEADDFLQALERVRGDEWRALS